MARRTGRRMALLGMLMVVTMLNWMPRRRQRIVALEVSGELRTFDDVVDTWHHVLLGDVVDVFGSCVNEDEAEHARLALATLGARTVRVGVRDDLALDHVPLFGPGHHFVRPAPGLELRPARTWLLQLQGIKFASMLRSQFQAETGTHYDLVVRLRYDLVFPEALPAVDETIVVPADQSHGGLNDKFAMGDPAAMTTYANLLSVLLSSSESSSFMADRARRASCPALLQDDDLVFQVELCLRWYLVDECHLTVLPRDDVKVQVRRSDGTVSAT